MQLILRRAVTQPTQNVDVQLSATAEGINVTVNGVPVVQLDKDGYVRRLKVDKARYPTFALRRLDDGRVAIRPKGKRTATPARVTAAATRTNGASNGYGNGRSAGC